MSLQNHISSEAAPKPSLSPKPKSARSQGSFLTRLFKKDKTDSTQRRHIRQKCFCPCKMSIANRPLHYEGSIMEVSKGGIKFKPAKTYILERKSVKIEIELPDLRLRGRIVATRSDGYGIALSGEFEDEYLDRFLEKFSA